MRLYRIAEEDLPSIYIIDPNTGAKLLTIKGYIDPLDLASRLIEFHEKNSYALVNLQRSPKPATDNTEGKDSLSIDEPAPTKEQATKEEAARPETDASNMVVEEETTTNKYDCSIYGEVPVEPGDKEPGVIRLALKLCNNPKRLPRRFLGDQTVRQLFAVVASLDEESRHRPFDLIFTGPPTVNLSNSLDQPLQDANLKNAMIQQKWL